MSEHYCNQCEDSDGDKHFPMCKHTGAIHTSGIECPSFGQKEREMSETHRSTNQTPPIRTFESGARDTNPKDALGVKKIPTSTLPTGPMYEVALAMLEGARKYGRHNYRTLGVKASVYYDAALRHITAWWEGEDIDEASGIHHLMKAAACLFVVRDSMLMKNWIDDRPPQYPEKLDVPRLNKLAQDMITKYPQCVKPFCHKVDRTAPTEGRY